MRTWIAGALVGLGLLAAGAAWTQTPPATPAPTSPAKNDYADPKTWLCLPGRDDACAQDLTATVVQADGAVAKEPFKAADKPLVDCFYVYPTVSNDPGGNSDMTANREELAAAYVQFARFRAVCRPFAPLYRQFTLTALRGFMTGKPIPADRFLGYNDVRDAWNWYLANENKGRGVILIGHSQGSGVLRALIENEIDGKPAQKLMVSAILLGTNVPVSNRTGMWGSIPLCNSASQTGCLISYVSFRADSPPPASSRFGKVDSADSSAACVNPGALAGGKGLLRPYFTNRASSGAGNAETVWAKGKTIDTVFVSTPGLVSAECVNKDGFSYLAVTVHGDPADARTDTIAGDVVVMGVIQKDWGLHLIDSNLGMGDQIDIAGQQAKAWTSK
ncbi:hypothetical protein QO010_004114 [Caulobacter ginsengisoli]|uniref:Lysophospholipase n=1 Tax=Caulobacter ginsengisoli TaxID=400775 RepID=A0ABU0IYB9_9CAUL|nr:DUF3089 domain-containing protein [Caulobacter ginsengisoli]MDQ0466321.1 hypothetical protein [Caulobacter ginsengisoli]